MTELPMTPSNPAPSHFAHLRDRHVTIVAFGDSITEVNHTTHGGLNWVGHLSAGLTDRTTFPQGYIVINSGISGDKVSGALRRVERDVLRFDPDIVVVSFGMNDASEVSPATFRTELKELVQRIKAHRPCSIVLRTFNPMIDMMTGGELKEASRDGKITKSGLAEFAEEIRGIAAAEGAILVDHYAQWVRSCNGPCRGDMIRLMSDPIHPNNLGHRRLYHEIAPVFGARRYQYYEWERALADDAR